MFFKVDQYAYYNYIYSTLENNVISNAKLLDFKNCSLYSKHIQTFLKSGQRQNFIEGIESLKNAHSYILQIDNPIEEKIELEIPTETISLNNFNASQLREDLFNIISNHYKDEDIDLVISGGGR